MEQRTYNCECGHSSDEHKSKQKGERRICLNPDCTCRAYNWDEDRGGVAVTRSVKN